MAANEKRVALVIGNSAYVNAMPLKNPRNDAKAMGTVLGRLGFKVISSIDLGRDAMEDKLVEFETAIGGASAAMLFYAGHGLQVKGHNYLIPVDADIRQEIQLKRRAFSLDELLDIMVRRAGASLVFLDACRDNPFSRSLLRGMSEEEQKRYLIRSGLAEVKASQGSFIAFATAPDNVAHDGKGANSPFTEALVAHIEAPGVSVSDMMIDVRKDVLRATDGKQEPWDQSSLRERFCFKALPFVEPVIPAQEPVKETPADHVPFDERELELQWWKRAEHTDDVALLAEFLQRFSSGVFAPLARDRLAELEWNRVKASRDAADFEAFIDRWPGSRFEAAARARLEALRRRAERSGKGIPWKMAAGIGAAAVVLVAGYTLWPNPDAQKPGTTAFKQKQPTPEELARAARKSVEAEDNTAYAAAKAEGTKAAFEAYLKKYGLRADEAKAQLGALDAAAYKAAERANTVEAFKEYRDDWPDGQYFSRAGQRIATLEAAAKAEADTAGKVRVKVGIGGGRDEAKWFTPGEGKSFRDCPDCPEMVVVPAKSFMMGAPKGEEGQSSDELPQHEVTIRQPFAVGKFAVTFAEWDACFEDGGCGVNKPNDRGWGRGHRPVINVSWDDAQAYVKWLSRKTGKTYRLLSEAEREYVTRAGTTTAFWWSNAITTDQANYDGNHVYGGGEKGKYRQETLPVETFQPNPWGLYQVHGNVYDWVQDCYHENYNGAPSDGSAWTTGDCGLRVLRGGSWFDLPQGLRAANRNRGSPVIRGYDAGFRVSRTLNP